MDETRQAVRNAYEWGRLKHAAERACFVLPTGLAALWVGASPRISLLMALTMFGLAAAGGWWRSALGEGALAGSATILIPTSLALVMQALAGVLTPAQCTQFCLIGSAGLGSMTGYVLGRSAGLRRRDEGRWFAGAALTTATFAMAVGCTALGFGSLFGLATGLLLVGVPSFVVARRVGPALP